MRKEITNLESDYLSNGILQADTIVETANKPKPTWKEYVEVTKTGIVRSNLLALITGMLVASYVSAERISLLTMVLAIIGATCILASATSLNNYIERDIDAKMTRTKNRALVEGRILPQQVLFFSLTLLCLGTILLLLVNLTTTLVALVGHVAYVGFYTLWSKPYHSINTIVGSISGAIPPVIGWTAVTGSLDLGAWILFAILFIWQPPHFLALAMRRSADYQAAGIPMLPVVNGFYESKRQILRYVAALIPVSLLLFFLPGIGWSYVIMVLILGLTWLIYSIMGFYTKDDIRWAKNNFLFSLLYLSIFCIGLIIMTI